MKTFEPGDRKTSVIISIEQLCPNCQQTSVVQLVNDVTQSERAPKKLTKSLTFTRHRDISAEIPVGSTLILSTLTQIACLRPLEYYAFSNWGRTRGLTLHKYLSLVKTMESGVIYL